MGVGGKGIIEGMIPLDAAAVRVLGALIEKEATTPEYYPLSLNALVNACNQKSNRHPVVEYDEDTVGDAIYLLREARFAVVITGNGRVTKYGQRISETLNLGRRELAVLCTLLLRGAQTLGEIRDRSERMYAFADTEETERVLEKMAELPDLPLVKKLARQPGQKEARYAHLLAGEPVVESETEAVAPSGSRTAQLEEEVRQLRADLDDLKRRFEELESQLR
jgi:uncharacterized protein YceH (UPF0502 family)